MRPPRTQGPRPGARRQYAERVPGRGRHRVRELGGLSVLGTERHESRRIDNQLRGRSGRQGDPGESRFYLSLEDDLMRLFATGASNWVMGQALAGDVPVEAQMVSKRPSSGPRPPSSSRTARSARTSSSTTRSLDEQRKVIHAPRDEVLDGADLRERI